MEFVFALACQDETFYVGRTKNLVNSFLKHKEGFAPWTTLHPAQSILELQSQEENDCYEISMVLKYMVSKGMGNVRGGAFSVLQYEPIHFSMFDLLTKELPFDEPRVIMVLQCEENKIFVDSWPLKDLPNRFQSHTKGTTFNAPFTCRFKALSILELCMDGPLEFQHLRLTLKYMKLKGIQNVRGSIFSSGEIQHSHTETNFISRLLQIVDGIYDDEDNLVEEFD